MTRLVRISAVLMIGSALLAGCQPDYSWDGSLEKLLLSQPERFSTVMQDPAKYRLQIIYTQIDRDADNQPTFTSYSYRLNPEEYFYPASTVKLPTALLALEKINVLNVAGLTRDTTMLTGVATEQQTAVASDPSSATGLPSIAHYIRKILLVSDNDAFNRLYEFLGPEPLNAALQLKGYQDTRIFHRLSVARDAEQNRMTNPITFIEDEAVIYAQPAQVSETDLADPHPILLGRGEMIDDKLVVGPKDFSQNNKYGLQDSQNLIRALMFPQSVVPERRFNLTTDDYQFIYRNMSAYPGESGIGEYSDATEYPEGYVKFLLFAGSAATIPRNIRIFNKVGDAYGFLTDSAYIVDFENNVEFLLAATLFTNENGIFNDDHYEYEQIGLPFMRDLGLAIYELELQRERQFAPDLSEFQLNR